MKTMGEKSFWVVRTAARFGLLFVHPIMRVQGRENIPEGACVICSNHVGLSDGPWLVFAIRPKKIMRIMVKAQLLHIPVLKYLFMWFNFIGVERESNDITAVKKALKALKEGEQLMLFPEGTRVKRGTRIPAKTGAAMFATRTGAPVLPVYLQVHRKLWRPIHIVIGKPYHMVPPGTRVKGEDLQPLTDELMDKIYGMESMI
ncbi:MAG: lysophospholipid acyltransferase family protein [Eubacteriales bacterium]